MTEYKFTFIDLFVGIGGLRMSAENAGGRCIFTSEWDKYAKLIIQFVKNVLYKTFVIPV